MIETLKELIEKCPKYEIHFCLNNNKPDKVFKSALGKLKFNTESNVISYSDRDTITIINLNNVQAVEFYPL